MSGTESLARGVAPSRPGTLHARSITGSLKVPPQPGRSVKFGRAGRPDVDLPVGADDLRVSRRHGEVTYRRHQWWLRNTGQQLIRLPRGQMLHSSSEPIPLAIGYTPLFVKGSGYREHLVELYVTDHDGKGLRLLHHAVTVPPKRWPLADDERLVLVVLGQRYLRYEDGPRPLSYRQAAEYLSCLRPEANWTERRIEHKVEAARHRLARGGFPYPVRSEKDSGGPSDNTLMHNLFRGLVESTTLVPPDLDLIDDTSGD